MNVHLDLKTLARRLDHFTVPEANTLSRDAATPGDVAWI